MPFSMFCVDNRQTIRKSKIPRGKFRESLVKKTLDKSERNVKSILIKK